MQFILDLYFQDLIGLNSDELTEFMPSVGQKYVLSFFIACLNSFMSLSFHCL